MLLMEDRFPSGNYEMDGEQIAEELSDVRAHVLWSEGSKAKRISYSTSHGGTLASINGVETSSLVSRRIGELSLPERKPTLQQLASLQERGNEELPVDHYTDCPDFFELVTGEKTHLRTKGSESTRWP